MSYLFPEEYGYYSYIAKDGDPCEKDYRDEVKEVAFADHTSQVQPGWMPVTFK